MPDNPNFLQTFSLFFFRFQTEYYISGIAPFGQYLVVLAYLEATLAPNQPSDQPPKYQSHRPELRIITRLNEEISNDALTIRGFEQYKANDYRLGYMSTECLFYVVSPRDIVVATPRDLDDHIGWLMERKRYFTQIIFQNFF